MRLYTLRNRSEEQLKAVHRALYRRIGEFNEDRYNGIISDEGAKDCRLLIKFDRCIKDALAEELLA